jgi:hypothetical protein
MAKALGNKRQPRFLQVDCSTSTWGIGHQAGKIWKNWTVDYTRNKKRPYISTHIHLVPQARWRVVLIQQQQMHGIHAAGSCNQKVLDGLSVPVCRLPPASRHVLSQQFGQLIRA